MDIQLESVENPKDSEEGEQLLESSLLKPSDSDEVVDTINTDALNEDSEKTEQEKVDDVSVENCLSNKNLNTKEIHETSPFKQAVKGFVLSKLSKKVGSHHILSGLTEKIVKKLEDNKDNSQPVSVSSSDSDLSISNLKVKDGSSEVISSSASCELKSVVANDLALTDSVNIEDAIECTEEPDSPVGKININLLIPQKNELRSNSISLPSTPAHQIPKRASSISFSSEHSESPKKYSNSPNLSFLGEIKTNDFESKSENSRTVDEIELEDITSKSSDLTVKNDVNLEISYPHNIYCSEKEEKRSLKITLSRQVTSTLYTFKNVFSLLTLSHIFLLTLIIVHNVGLFSSYLAFIFDGVVIAYVLYAYICTLIQKPSVSRISFPFSDPHLESASIQVQKNKKIVKGSVKVLKGEYDPEMVKNHSTDLVDISIENCCLKIYVPKKKNKENSANVNSFTFYDILGATVSVVPKDLSKKRIWNKKYPICIAFPCITKCASTLDDENDANLPSADYLSSAFNENDEAGRKALYFFALTDREKESLFWAILRNTEESSPVKCNETACDISPRIDFSKMTYTTLLEMNNEDNLLPNKDISEDESSVAEKMNVDLDFEKYMKHLFENFDRMVKFSSRSRSFQDLSNLKEDIPILADPFMSKDDTFLSSSTKEYTVDWLNIFLGRLFYDFLTQKYWNDDVKGRIQKKLDKIEMPSFIESLEVTDVFLGTSLPQIHTVSSPVADINGVWFNVDFNYCGSFQMTLKTKLKMTKANQMPVAEAVEQTNLKLNMHSPQLSESDDDEDIEAKVAAAKKKKFINRIERWISHKHFQTVAQSRFVKKYVGDLSNMPLTLTVELNTLHGILTLNIPPAPSDRIWYGFRKDPVLLLNAYPKVGTHEINLSAVVQMIEKKLIQEFKKALVMPNMDDLLIPVMYSPIYEF